MSLASWLRRHLLHDKCAEPENGVARATRRVGETQQLVGEMKGETAELHRILTAPRGGFLEGAVFPPRVDGPPTAPRGTVRKETK